MIMYAILYTRGKQPPTSGLTLQRDNIEITTSLVKVRGGFSMLKTLMTNHINECQ